MGDFISHILNCNSLVDFNSNLSTLIQKDFLEELKNFSPKQLNKPTIDTAKFFQNKHSIILESINSTFELRHIFCHEFATNIELDYAFVKGIYEHCKVFLIHVNDYIWELIEPNPPITQAEMNIRSGEKFKDAESRLKETIEKVKKLEFSDSFISINNESFDKLIDKWKEFRKLKAEVVNEYSKNGTIFPTLYTNSLTSTTEKMINELYEEYGL